MISAVSTTVKFDYSEFDAATRGKLESAAAAIGKHREKAVSELMAVAKEVAKAHGVLAAAGCEGKFNQWVESECPFSRATAYRLRDTYLLFGDCEYVANIDDDALRVLSRKEMPDDMHKWAKRKAKSGRVTKPMVMDQFGAWKAENVDEDDEPQTVEEEDDGTCSEEWEVSSEADDCAICNEMEDEGGDDRRDTSYVAPFDFGPWKKALKKVFEELETWGIENAISEPQVEEIRAMFREGDRRVRRART
jgi:hypothetical protein